MSRSVDFDYGPDQKDFMDQMKNVLVQQDDYRGIGGHGVEDHGDHGLHRQTSIGIGEDTTANFRELIDG